MATKASGGPKGAVTGNQEHLAGLWWMWIVFGILWTVAALVILQENDPGVAEATVGLIVGIMFLVTAFQNLVIASLIEGGVKWLFGIFGVVFIAAGIVALANPQETFRAIADVLGFLFLIVGVFWIIEAFAMRAGNDLWWMGLIAGILMVVLAFITSGQLFWEKQQLLLLFAGIWALMAGITDFVRAWQIKQLD